MNGPFDSIPPIPSNEKKFIHMHKIRKLETQIVTTVQLMFAAKPDIRGEFLKELKRLSDELAELENV